MEMYFEDELDTHELPMMVIFASNEGCILLPMRLRFRTGKFHLISTKIAYSVR